MKYAAQPKAKSIQDIKSEATLAAAGSRLRHKTQWRMLFAWLAIQDIALIYAAFLLAYFLRFNTSISLFELDVIPLPEYYQSMWLVMLPIWFLVYIAFGLYSKQNILAGTREASLLFNASSVCAVALVAADFFSNTLVVARGWILMAWAGSILLVGLGRLLVRLLVFRLRCSGFLSSNTLIVGANAEGKSLVEQLHRPQYSGLNMVGFVDESLPAGTAVSNGVRILGGMDDIDDLVQRNEVEELILTSSALTQEQIVKLFEKYGVSGQTNIRLSSGLYEIITTGIEVTEFACVPLVRINRVRLTGLSQIEKALVDYAIAIPLAILMLPIFAVLALLIRLDSPGPIIHRRRVMGVNGQQFDAFKFRTMYVNGDAMLEKRPDLKLALERDGKLKDDPRVTKIGAFIRKLSLDELPQIWNVLLNEMSIVGPRMISPPEMSIYKQHGMNLLTVKPGITGLWQVSGRSDVTYEERVRLDMYYIRNWSIWLDIQLLWRTIPAVIERRGAY